MTYVTENFIDRYKELNKEQREAVDSIEGPVMVIAGPGTGKTEVLTMRIANILEKTETPPEKILALTFTESGAISMRRRLSELVGKNSYRVEISTFHGFANRIIRDYPDYFPHIIGASNITEIDQITILRHLIDTLPLKELRPFGDRYYYLRNIMSAISELKRQGIDPDGFKKIAADEKKSFYANPDLINQSGKYEGKMKTKYLSPAKHVERNEELATMYEKYQQALRSAKQYDYSDMIMFVSHALEENEDMLRVLRDTYDFFLVDEHQDTNDGQNKIIELMAGGSDRPNLFVVGDEKQAIFRFQGASLENFHYFKKKYRDVALISLRNNYRSTQAILNAAHMVSPREVALTANAGHPEVPAHVVALSSPDVEYYFIARTIKELIDEKEDPKDIAVIYRDNKDVIPLVRMLEREKVPFNIESDQDVLGDEEIKKLIRILRAVQHFGNDVALVEMLHVDFLGIPPLDVYKLFSFAGKNRKKVYDVLRSAEMLGLANIESKDACLTLFEKLSAWKKVSKNKGAGESFEMIVHDSGFLNAIVNHPSTTEKIAKLHALFDILKSFIARQKSYTLNDFFEYLDIMSNHGIAVKSAETLRLVGRVRLMTAHRAKGQEFDRVFVMNAIDRKWGSRFHREHIKLPRKIYRVLESVENILEEDDEDERNVFYVALTRAKKELFVTLAKTDHDGKEQLPSKFIAELKEDVLVPYDADLYERKFSAHREMMFAPISAKTPELKDKDFLSALFEEKGVSVTALNNYLSCPWKYFYRNLIRIPESPNKHLSFGNAIHAALKNYFDALTAKENKGKAYLIARFEEAMAREPIEESEYKEACEKGKKALAAYYDEYHAEWSPHAANEVKISGVTVGDVIPVNGKIDRIEFSGDAHARIIDYKTGKPKTRNEIEGNTKSSTGDYKRQLVFYKLLLEKEGKYDMTSGVIQFIEPDERGKFHQEEFTVVSGEVKELEALIVSVANEIRSLSFWDRCCDDAKCKYCELRRGMQ
ncbi:MAG: ATP-dependent helicase [Patescibacteria group bacterium]|nr:ATP-dependent helicase [Patescibacteria group bacterium]